MRLCSVGEALAARGHDWYVGDAENVPGLASESVIIKIGENVARLSAGLVEEHPQVPWSPIKRMRDRLAHQYEETDYGAVWDTLVGDLPVIRNYIVTVLGS
ncbi:HepT-like ribonuclease domain-containing protein [Brevibacterium sp. 91QC2O2]|uniref:HepT-like ribonuclease domain-containing protein n=1 Tax=Brevibacterium sp. 91QC2O2 TaxID=2968458 RepID=UPI00211CF8D9